MKRFCLILILILSAFFGCSETKDKSNAADALLGRLLIRNQLANRSSTTAITSELPNNLAVPVPRSIRKPSTTSSSRSRQALLHFSTRGASAVYDNGITGLSFLQEGTSVVSEILQESKRDLILISSAYSQAKASPGVCIPGGTGATSITQAMIDELVSGMERLGLSNAEAKAEVANLQSEGVLPTVNQSVPSPAMKYTALTDGDYDVQIDFSFSDSIGSPLACPSNNKFQKTIKFNADKSKIFSSSSKTLNVFGTSLEISASITYKSEVGKKDTALLNINKVTTTGRNNKTKSSTKFTFEECNKDSSANTGNCVTLSYTSTEEKDANKITTKVDGRTDDDGGYVITKYNDPSATENADKEYTINETYDPSGNITYYKVTDNVGTVYSFGTLDLGTYGDYYATSYSFDGEVFLDLVVGNAASVGSSSATAPYDSYDEFVIYPDGIDPNDDPDLEYNLGYGYFQDDGGGNGYDVADEVYIEFYGTSEDLTGVKIWRSVYDASGDQVFDDDGNPTYTLTNNTVTTL